MSDSHTWTENCVVCGGACELGKAAKDKPPPKPHGEHPFSPPDKAPESPKPETKKEKKGSAK